MRKNDGKGKSERKPFRDISNRRIESSKSTRKNKARPDQDDRIGSGDTMDRLLLVHSDVSNLLRQIDELVVQVVKAEETDKQGRKEIESFTRVLSDMVSSLKPWVPRLQKAFSVPSMEFKKQSVELLDNEVQSPEPTEMECLVSPSPLVSWRATDCNVEMGKQLFALTPLPRPKTTITKGQSVSKSVALQRFNSSAAVVPSCFSKAENTANGKCDGLLKKQNLEESPSHVAKKMRITNSVLATPCLKMSSITSCKLLEPTCGFSNRKFDKVYKSTPFPLGKQVLSELLDDDESSGTEAPQSTGFKYSRSVFNPMYSVGKGKKTFDASPAWFMSPPKTCILMDPSDDKPFEDDESEALSGAFEQHMTLASSKRDDVKEKSNHTLKSTNNLVNGQNGGSSFALVESTPMWKEPRSTVYKGKRPGENTLKKELWVRFEAASMDGLNLNLTFPRETDRKGFLDMLEEAS